MESGDWGSEIRDWGVGVGGSLFGIGEWGLGVGDSKCFIRKRGVGFENWGVVSDLKRAARV